ncbi:hypothetical protein BSKO_04418 [Bryopsis sp. KO-2023]|nr:hypothetical protein BSKO_04418 [Bryopsis sp. KO-2023]
MFQARPSNVPVARSVDFGELPEGAIDIFAKDPPQNKSTGLQRPTIQRKNRTPVRRALSPIKEEGPLAKPSPVANDVLNRLKERSNKRLQSMRKRTSKEKVVEHKKTAARQESRENEATSSSTGRDTKSNRQTEGHASKGRGETISSLVKRFRESPPLPREQRDGSQETSTKAKGGKDFWWIEVGENTLPQSSGGETQVGRLTSSTPSFFDIDNLDSFDADTVLAKSMQLTKEDAKHKEMLDRLCKKYLNSDEQASTTSFTNEGGGIEWGCTMGQGREESNFAERDTTDVLEKWRKRWKNEIDISSPVKTAASSDVDVQLSFDSLISGIQVSATTSSAIDFMDGSSEMGIENNPVKGVLEGLGSSNSLGGFPSMDENEGRSMALVSPENQHSTVQFEWSRELDEFRKRRDSSAMDIDSPLRLQFVGNSGETAQRPNEVSSLWGSELGAFPSGIEGSPMDVDDRPNAWQQSTSFFVSFGKPFCRWDRPPLPKKFGTMVDCSSPPGVDKMDEDGRSPTVGGVVSTLVECTVSNFLFSSGKTDSPMGSAMEIEPEKEISFFSWDMI